MEGDAWILAMVKISYRFLALAEIDLKHCYKMTGATSFCSKFCLLQNGTPSRKHASYKMAWFRGKIVLQNDSVCYKNESPTWTWVHPFYSRNWHRDIFPLSHHLLKPQSSLGCLHGVSTEKLVLQQLSPQQLVEGVHESIRASERKQSRFSIP